MYDQILKSWGLIVKEHTAPINSFSNIRMYLLIIVTLVSIFRIIINQTIAMARICLGRERVMKVEPRCTQCCINEGKLECSVKEKKGYIIAMM